ncbi:amidohydrolase [Maricaulis sp.]|uniref:amidohydrolase n=1 Tax=unclassified Maricaulis TaxID=2632371 RepID=UPI0025C50D29|nr:amidohydrolase [Maricaulis sp.]
MKLRLLSAVAVLALAACSPADNAAQTEEAAVSGDVPMDGLAETVSAPGDDALREAIRADYTTHIGPLYEHFHANPELSFMEIETAARMAEEMRALGFEVTEGVGRTGVVGVLRNGEGATVTLRADMDALPMQENTDVSYASTVVGQDRIGNEFPVMHACAHDTHMAALIGAARQLSERTDEWSGTLVLIAQPAEELGLGAVAMLDDGLYERFPLPDYNLSFHTFASTAVGDITYHPGYAMANVDSVDIYVQGRGGHGAYPHTTKDPIYLASQIVVALQGLVSRELNPLEPGVVTVGAFHAGTKHNIIGPEAHLQLTVRSYSDDVRAQLLEGIQRIAASQAASYGLEPDEYPRVEIEETYTPSLFNDPVLAARAVSVMRSRFGSDHVREVPPIMGGEDYSQYHRTEHEVPTFMFWVGGTTQARLEDYDARGMSRPSNHTPEFAPDDPMTTITQATEAMTAVTLDLLAPVDGAAGGN